MGIYDDGKSNINTFSASLNYLIIAILFLLVHISNIIVFYTLENKGPLYYIKGLITGTSYIIIGMYTYYSLNKKIDTDKNGSKNNEYGGILLVCIILYITIWFVIMLFSPDMVKLFKLKIDELSY